MDNIPFKLNNGEDKKLTIWDCPAPARAVMLIIHGMSEHIERYSRLAKALNKSGIAVAGFNLAGHGVELSKDNIGVFGTDGWNNMIADVSNAYDILKSKYPGIPLIMLGHSMGSFLLRCYIMRFENKLPDMLVLSGTGYYDKTIVRLGSALAGFMSIFTGKDKPSKLISSLVFPKDKKAKTAFDWLSRDAFEVERYIKDPICGFPLSSGAYKDFFGGLMALTNEGLNKAAKPNMPVLFISGEMDPIGKGDGVKKVANNFIKSGYKNVHVKLYPEARHELFNELNRDSVTEELTMWIDDNIEKFSEAAQ